MKMWQKYEEVTEIKNKCERKSMKKNPKMECDCSSMWTVWGKKLGINELE